MIDRSLSTAACNAKVGALNLDNLCLWNEIGKDSIQSLLSPHLDKFRRVCPKINITIGGSLICGLELGSLSS